VICIGVCRAVMFRACTIHSLKVDVECI